MKTEKPATRMLRATVVQRQEYERRKKDGKLAKHIDLAPYIAELKRAREFREAVGDPTPTPERLQKGDLTREWKETPRGVKYRQFGTRGIVQQKKKEWPDNIYAGFTKLVYDFEVAARAEAAKIGSYEGMSGNTPGPKLGGARHIKASEAMARLRTIKRSLAPELWQTLTWLVLEAVAEKTGRYTTPESAGQKIWPAITGKRDCQMIALGALKTAGAQLAYVYMELEKNERQGRRRAG